MQRVAIRTFKDQGDTIAFFLDQPEGPGCCVSYQPGGSHVRAVYPQPLTRPATKGEARAMLRALRARGYQGLKVVTRGQVAS